ncbi:hypothetical protein XELAEV_18006044mg [Xenopus laevis]|uniref:Uncharacterized protein n=1 Tax=Xenopus laevis TaxID=8355 RepID=A0A974I378_XENLA|nr:hypothetical protein XELAEV_18006044mg [Xenopus laevis]
MVFCNVSSVSMFFNSLSMNSIFNDIKSREHLFIIPANLVLNSSFCAKRVGCKFTLKPLGIRCTCKYSVSVSPCSCNSICFLLIASYLRRHAVIDGVARKSLDPPNMPEILAKSFSV